MTIPAGTIFNDLVYNPLETVFLNQARQVGTTTVDGLGMLVHQAALAFRRWTGQEASLEVMTAAVADRAG